jgi:hypothetical protein
MSLKSRRIYFLIDRAKIITMYRTSVIAFFLDIVHRLYFNKINDALQVIRNKLSLDDTLPNRSSMQIEDIMELL